MYNLTHYPDKSLMKNYIPCRRFIILVEKNLKYLQLVLLIRMCRFRTLNQTPHLFEFEYISFHEKIQFNTICLGKHGVFKYLCPASVHLHVCIYDILSNFPNTFL